MGVIFKVVQMYIFPMIKLLSAVAITAASILPIGEAKAASGWENFVAQRACTYLRQGSSIYDSTFRAGMDTLGTRYQGGFLTDTQRLSSDELGVRLATRMYKICPSALTNAM